MRLAILLTTVAVTLLSSLVTPIDITRQIGGFDFQFTDNGISLISSRNEQESSKSFSAELGAELPRALLAEARVELTDEGVRLRVGRSTVLEVATERAGRCTSITWSSQELTEIVDCIDYGTSQWYGAFEQRHQEWPVQKLTINNMPYVTQGVNNMGIAERFWLNSEGVYIYIEPYVPLFISSNATGDNKLCFNARFEEPFKSVSELRLHYQLCAFPTTQEAHVDALETVLNARPSELPDLLMVTHPIWSTWARYKRDINQSLVLSFAQEILDHGYNNSQIEIDDDWETCYGELTFDPVKFPDPAGLSQQLKDMGYRVTLWIHPFMNENCPSFDAYKAAGYFVSDSDGNTRTTWWNGISAAAVDFTNPEAEAWFIGRIRALQALSEVDSFKFDAGETEWLPKPRELMVDPAVQPNVYTSSYVRSLVEFVPLAEVRVGMQTQDLPLWVRVVDKDSRWGLRNGLKSLVTTLLTMNTAGYSYVLPDMIGGNSYGIDVVTPELFVRWLQASVFMPALQFSFVPWDFDDPQIEAICMSFVELHAEYAPMIMELANRSVETGLPINAPLWAIALPGGSDEDVYKIDDEFLLGHTLLVAPVMEEGATSRDVYLPQGPMWIDMNTGTFYDGGQWIRNYPAPLSVLPHFRIAVFSGALPLHACSALVLTLLGLLLRVIR